jgi:uncharacterized protein
MQDKLKFVCTCGKVISAPAEAAGKKGKCPRCGEIVRIPDLSSISAEADIAPEVPQPTEPPADSPAAATPLPPPILQSVRCSRCGKTVAADLSNCPFCDARLPVATPLLPPTNPGVTIDTPRIVPHEPDVAMAVTRLLIFYLLLLSTNLIAHWIARAYLGDAEPDRNSMHKLVFVMLAVETVDVIIVAASLAMIPWPPKPSLAISLPRPVGWLAGAGILVAVLALNFAYHAALRNFVQYPHWAQDHMAMPIGWGILLVCIQPAVVEELFFRFIALGTLAQVMNVAAAIAVSSVMFGMAHSAVFLSIPILTVVGVGLGFARVLSGSMVLPMVMHALHNAVVLYLESTR